MSASDQAAHQKQRETSSHPSPEGRIQTAGVASGPGMFWQAFSFPVALITRPLPFISDWASSSNASLGCTSEWRRELN